VQSRGGVEVDNQWLLRVGVVIRCMNSGVGPRGFSGCGADGVDPGECGCLAGGESCDQPGNRRLGCDQAEHGGLFAQGGGVGGAVTTDGEEQCEVEQNVARSRWAEGLGHGVKAPVKAAVRPVFRRCESG
jgi:hypothetical protein